MSWLSARYAVPAFTDLREGLLGMHVWATLGWQEIRQRYRRQKIGPFWLTISTGVMIGAMGPLYGRLMNIDLATYFSYLAVSFIVWQLLASLVTDACQVFIATESIIKQIRLPLSIHVLRLVWRDFIIFAHNLIILVPVLAFFPPPSLGWGLLLLPVGLFLLWLNALWVALFLGMLCARFRDVPQIVASVVQVCFFLTPVLWKVEMLGRHAWAAKLNPFFHFLEVVRGPLLDGGIPADTWLAVALITVAGWSATFVLFARFRARIAYWV